MPSQHAGSPAGHPPRRALTAAWGRATCRSRRSAPTSICMSLCFARACRSRIRRQLNTLERLALRLRVERAHACLGHGVHEDNRVRHQPFGKPLAEVIVDMRCGHRRALLDDDAGQRSDRGAAGRRGMPRPPTHDVALAPGHARHLSPAAATASRRLSKIFVTV
jgi:hypothetical protein